MKEYILKKSSRKDKKYMVINTNTNKIIHFGASGHGDFIYYHKHDKIKANIKKYQYIKRHSKLNEDWKNTDSAGFWAKYILWNKPTLQESIKYIEEKFKMKIIYK